jgi:hypothetical protein
LTDYAKNVMFLLVTILQRERGSRSRKKGLKMKARNFIAAIGSGAAMVMAVALMAALPAQAGSGLTKVTHSDTPYTNLGQPVSKPVVIAQPAQRQATSGEVQVAVLASKPAQAPARRAVFIRR